MSYFNIAAEASEKLLLPRTSLRAGKRTAIRVECSVIVFTAKIGTA